MDINGCILWQACFPTLGVGVWYKGGHWERYIICMTLLYKVHGLFILFLSYACRSHADIKMCFAKYIKNVDFLHRNIKNVIPVCLAILVSVFPQTLLLQDFFVTCTVNLISTTKQNSIQKICKTSLYLFFIVCIRECLLQNSTL